MVCGLSGCAGEQGPVPATPEEQDYIDQVVARFYLAGYSLNTLSSIYDNPKPDDDEWRDTAEALLDQVTRMFEGAATLNPPPSLADLHQKAVKTLGHWNTAALLLKSDYDAGIYEFSEEVEVELAIADETFEEVDALLNEFLTDHPIPDVESKPSSSGSADESD